MSRPGVDVSLLDVPTTAISIPTDTGVSYITGETERGVTGEAVVVSSLNDFVTKFGDRVSWSVLYDWVETYFREGGYRLWVSRVVGPDATTGTLNLLDATSGVSLTATALGEGDWSANFKLEVLAGTITDTFDIQVQDTDGNVLEDSGDLNNQDEAVAWSSGSIYMRLAIGASAEVPDVAAATAMSAGDDDRSGVTDDEWETAQTFFYKDLGPGQIVQAGRTSDEAHGQLSGHAVDNNRVAVCDLPDTATQATLESAVENSRWAASFAPWVKIPGFARNGFRTVPPSALICGLVARNDPVLGSNRASAANAGISKYCTGISQPAFTDTDREVLNNAGVNVVRVVTGGAVVNYGFRSGANPITDRNWIDFANSRFFTKLSAELNAVGQNFVFDEIDGQKGHTIGKFHDALVGVMLTHYQARELFGDTAEESFQVDTGPGVNTLETIANQELHAIVYVKMAPMAEWVQIQIVKQAIN